MPFKRAVVLLSLSSVDVCVANWVSMPFKRAVVLLYEIQRDSSAVMMVSMPFKRAVVLLSRWLSAKCRWLRFNAL